MTIIPENILEKWGRHAQNRTETKLKDLLELRDIIEENTHHPVMQIYKEAADALGYSSNTIQRNLRIIRAYSEGQLLYWISRRLGFDHIEAANFYQTRNKAASWLLDKAIDPGNETGVAMTVDELIVFANGERVYTKVAIQFKNLLTRLGDFPHRLGWDADKTARFRGLWEQLKEFVE